MTTDTKTHAERLAEEYATSIRYPMRADGTSVEDKFFDRKKATHWLAGFHARDAEFKALEAVAEGVRKFKSECEDVSPDLGLRVHLRRLLFEEIAKLDQLRKERTP